MFTVYFKMSPFPNELSTDVETMDQVISFTDHHKAIIDRDSIRTTRRDGKESYFLHKKTPSPGGEG